MRSPYRFLLGVLAGVHCLGHSLLAFAGDLSFDGKREAVALDSVSDHFTGADLGRILLTVAPSWQPDDATVEELIALYRALQGDHPDWNEYREAMVADRRLVVRLRPSRAYGMLPG